MQRRWEVKSPRCSRQRCSKPARVDKLCATHAKHEADRLFSLAIRERDGRCVRCNGTFGLQCAHKISRRYLATRWKKANAVALCSKCHLWQTHNPLEGDAFFDELVLTHKFSPLAMWELRHHALTDPVPDIADVLEELRG